MAQPNGKPEANPIELTETPVGYTYNVPGEGITGTIYGKKESYETIMGRLLYAFGNQGKPKFRELRRA